MSLKLYADLYCINESRTRQTGKTTALIEACRKIGGIFVAYSSGQANILKEKYPDVDITYLSERILRGTIKPIVFDHFLLELLLRDISRIRIHNLTTIHLERKLEEIKEELLSRLWIGA